jgi:hypothetical protein
VVSRLRVSRVLGRGGGVRRSGGKGFRGWVVIRRAFSLLRMSSLFRFLRGVGMVFDGGEGGEDVCIATIADNGLPSQAGRWRGIDAGDVYARKNTNAPG